MRAHTHMQIYMWILASSFHFFQLVLVLTLLCISLHLCQVASFAFSLSKGQQEARWETAGAELSWAASCLSSPGARSTGWPAAASDGWCHWESQTICPHKISSPWSVVWRQECFSLENNAKIFLNWYHGLRPSETVESKWFFNYRYMQCKTKSQLKFMGLCWAMLTRHSRTRIN